MASRRFGLGGVVLIVALAGAARGAAAQSWTPPAGSGSVSLTFQDISNTGHRLTDGLLIPDGKSRDAAMAFAVDYALTDRLAVSAGIPLVFARYLGPNPPPFGDLPVDHCRCWQHGFQDVVGALRYGLGTGRVGITPSFSVTWPSHAYQYQGEAVVGRHLREARFGIDAGTRLDAISERLAVQGSYAYTLVERALDLSHNTSSAAVEGDVRVSNRVSARGFVTWQRTHGGLRTGSLPPYSLAFPGDINTDERVAEHDRLLRDNHLDVGAGASVQADGFDVFGSVLWFARGTDAHAGHALTVGISIPFEWRPRAR